MVEQGTVWIFGAIEHWKAACVGLHACKIGYRFNAMEPVKQGIRSGRWSLEYPNFANGQVVPSK